MDKFLTLKIQHEKKPESAPTCEIIMPTCPIDGGKWIYYDGAIGYESHICEKCRLDIQDIKIMFF